MVGICSPGDGYIGSHGSRAEVKTCFGGHGILESMVSLMFLEVPQVMECLGMTHALGLMRYILCLVDHFHDAHSYTELVGKHTC